MNFMYMKQKADRVCNLRFCDVKAKEQQMLQGDVMEKILVIGIAGGTGSGKNDTDKQNCKTVWRSGDDSKT